MKSASEKLIKCGCGCWCDAACSWELSWTLLSFWSQPVVFGRCCRAKGGGAFFGVCAHTQTRTHRLDRNYCCRTKFRKMCCLCPISWRVWLKKLGESISTIYCRFPLLLTLTSIHTHGQPLSCQPKHTHTHTHKNKKSWVKQHFPIERRQS